MAKWDYTSNAAPTEGWTDNTHTYPVQNWRMGLWSWLRLQFTDATVIARPNRCALCAGRRGGNFITGYVLNHIVGCSSFKERS